MKTFLKAVIFLPVIALSGCVVMWSSGAKLSGEEVEAHFTSAGAGLFVGPCGLGGSINRYFIHFKGPGPEWHDAEIVVRDEHVKIDMPCKGNAKIDKDKKILEVHITEPADLQFLGRTYHVTVTEKEPNQPLEPTPMAVTTPAAQESRRP